MDMRSGWLDISQVLFCVFIDREKVEVNKNTNRRSQYPAMWEISSTQDRLRGGGGVHPCNRLMGMYRWMGLHFHDWIDYNGALFSLELLEWDRTFSVLRGIRKFR